MSIFTIGHGTLTVERFIELLRAAGVDEILDVRKIPRSRANPQFAMDALADALRGAGIAYKWEPHLGGFRGKTLADSPNLGLRNASFRRYADYMRSDAFRRAIETHFGAASSRSVAILCSESLWWRCHRRLIADYLILVRDRPVIDLMHDGKRVLHVPTPGAQLSGHNVVYPSEASPGLLMNP